MEKNNIADEQVDEDEMLKRQRELQKSIEFSSRRADGLDSQEDFRGCIAT